MLDVVENGNYIPYDDNLNELLREKWTDEKDRDSY